ncbi:MAG: hypothetical protein WKF84_09260 [Pyrinomonadaceae bacterium]
MQTLLAPDLRYGFRMLWKRPGFTFVAIITLALGIGATTAIFSVVSAVLLRPLPYPEADQLMWIGQQFPSERQGAGEPKFLFWRCEQGTSCFGSCSRRFQDFSGGGNLAGGNEPECVRRLARLRFDFFHVFGSQPCRSVAPSRKKKTCRAASR